MTEQHGIIPVGVPGVTCGQKWHVVGVREHECNRTPGHAVIVTEAGGRIDHWCACGVSTSPLRLGAGEGI